MKSSEKLFKRLLIAIPVVIVSVIILYGLGVYIKDIMDYKSLEVDDEFAVHEYSGDDPEKGMIEEDNYGNYKYNLADNQVLIINRDKLGMHGLAIYDVVNNQVVDSIDLEITYLYTTNNGDISGFNTMDGDSYKFDGNIISPFTSQVESIIPSSSGYTYIKDNVLYSNGQEVAYDSFDCRFNDLCYNSTEMVAQVDDEIYFLDRDRQLYIFNQATSEVTEGKMFTGAAQFIQTGDNSYILSNDTNMGLVIQQYADGDFQRIDNPLGDAISGLNQYHFSGDKLYIDVSTVDQSTIIYEVNLNNGKYSELFNFDYDIGEFYNDYYYVRGFDGNKSRLYDLKTGEVYTENNPLVILDTSRYYNGIIIDSNQLDIEMAIHAY